MARSSTWSSVQHSMSRRLFSQTIDSDDDDNDDTSLRSALPISKKKADLVNGIPVSGEDYLLLVRKEFKNCEKTCVAKEQPKETKTGALPLSFQMLLRSEPTASPEILPDPDWQQGFVTSFQSYASCMQKSKHGVKKSIKLPPRKSTVKSWHDFCYGEELSNDKLNAIATMPQATIMQLLKFHQEWLTTMTKAESRWILSLLLYLDPVMTVDSVTILRELARKCIKLRNAHTEQNEQVAHLNMVITIISKVFRQADLV